MKRPIRILLAKIGLDGHDRGVKVLARSFREAGFEVIYTGLWQTCEATMYAAMQEDVDIVGASLLSAAHMTVVPELVRYRRELGVENIPILLGGIIPETDHETVLGMGVAAIFNPGASTADIVTRIREMVASSRSESDEDLVRGYKNREPVSLARLITRLQRDGLPGGIDLEQGKATIVGVTGAPGVGKSSFIGKLGGALRERGLKVAVLAVDPTSPINGGALLGDRLRMMRGKPDADFFIRSVASGDVQGGLGPKSEEIIRLFDGFDFDVVLVETVGAGQSDFTVREIVDHVLLLVMPESGDAIQFSKAGIMEIATHFVLNKCDLDGADATHAQMIGALGDSRPIWRISTINGEGIGDVADWLVQSRSR